MAVGKGVTLFAWTRETYLRLDKELETPSKVFQVFPLKNSPQSKPGKVQTKRRQLVQTTTPHPAHSISPQNLKTSPRPSCLLSGVKSKNGASRGKTQATPASEHNLEPQTSPPGDVNYPNTQESQPIKENKHGGRFYPNSSIINHESRKESENSLRDIERMGSKIQTRERKGKVNGFSLKGVKSARENQDTTPVCPTYQKETRGRDMKCI